jgi:hypothetical protein
MGNHCFSTSIQTFTPEQLTQLRFMVDISEASILRWVYNSLLVGGFDFGLFSILFGMIIIPIDVHIFHSPNHLDGTPADVIFRDQILVVPMQLH